MHLSIRWKTYLIFVLSFLFFIAVTFLIVSHTMVTSLRQRALVQAEQQTEILEQVLLEKFKTLSTVYYNIIFDGEIQEELQQPSEEANYQRILRKFDYYMMANDYTVFSIYLYDPYRRRLVTTEEYAAVPVWEDPFLKWGENEKPALGTLASTTGETLELVTYSGWMREDYFGEPICYVWVNMLQSALGQAFPDDAENGSMQFLLDDHGEVTYSSPNASRMISELPLEEHSPSPQHIEVEGKDYLLLRSDMKSYGWSYLQLIPESSLYQESSRLYKTFGILFLLFSVLMLFIAYWIFSGITVPIVQLAGMVEKYRNGQKKSKPIALHRQDEIGLLYQSVQNMTQRIDHLIEDVYQAEFYKKETQLRMYREGINPHFIYNVLDSIQWTLKFQNTEKAIEVIQDFSRYLRGTLSRSRDLITIREMQEQLKAYARLSSFLRDEEIRFHISFPESWAEKSVISFLLQPIVENCFKHAFPNRGGSISVYGEEHEAEYRFYVEDDGIGMTPEQIRDLEEHIQNYDVQKQTEHFGLASIQQRVFLYYGKEYKIQLRSQNEIGTIVMVRIPQK